MVKKGYYGNKGLILAWGLKAHFCYAYQDLWHVGLKKILLNLGLKGVIEKRLGCLLVYPF